MKQFFDAESVRTAITGLLGMSATGGGFYVSILPKVEAWLRVCSLFIGCAVGIASLVSIIRKQRQRRLSSKTAEPQTKTKNEENQN